MSGTPQFSIKPFLKSLGIAPNPCWATWSTFLSMVLHILFQSIPKAMPWAHAIKSIVCQRSLILMWPINLPAYYRPRWPPFYLECFFPCSLIVRFLCRFSTQSAHSSSTLEGCRCSHFLFYCPWKILDWKDHAGAKNPHFCPVSTGHVPRGELLNPPFRASSSCPNHYKLWSSQRSSLMQSWTTFGGSLLTARRRMVLLHYRRNWRYYFLSPIISWWCEHATPRWRKSLRSDRVCSCFLVMIQEMLLLPQRLAWPLRSAIWVRYPILSVLCTWYSTDHIINTQPCLWPGHDCNRM